MGSLILYTIEDGKSRIQPPLAEGQTVWLSQAELAELFEVMTENIRQHLKKSCQTTSWNLSELQGLLRSSAASALTASLSWTIPVQLVARRWRRKPMSVTSPSMNSASSSKRRPLTSLMGPSWPPSKTRSDDA